MVSQILVIEDSPEICFTLAEYLKRGGFSTLIAENGAVGLAYLNKEISIGLIILDLQMPILDGYEFIKAKAKDPRFNNIPVIIFSSEPNAAELVGKAGVVAAFPKTVDIESLVNFIRSTSFLTARKL